MQNNQVSQVLIYIDIRINKRIHKDPCLKLNIQKPRARNQQLKNDVEKEIPFTMPTEI